jgi:sigma-E factor negative regulatory protein RseB
MRLRSVMLCLVGLMTAAVQASEVSAPQLLTQMTEAARTLEYRGRLLYLHGTNLSTLELLHARIDGRDYERLTQLDGQLAEVIRRGEHVVCVHADQTITRLANRNSVSPLGLNERLDSSIPRQYQVSLDGSDRVAGRSVNRLLLQPLDEFRYGYRLWIDQESNLLLKSELVDQTGAALERLEFISLELAPGLTMADFEVPAAMKERALDTLDASHHPQGRVVVQPAWLPDGFIEADRDLRLTGGERRPVTAATFSDGLAAFTLFIEENDEGAHEGASRMGPTVAITRRLGSTSGRWLVTLVGEVPELTAERVLGNLSIGSP